MKIVRPRRHSNTSLVLNAMRRRDRKTKVISTKSESAIDRIRVQVIAISSAPLTGLLAEQKIQRDRQGEIHESCG